MSRIVTRKDIADRAGVSVSVVSRAINNSGYVEESKKQRILSIAEELGYSPNPVALSLSSRKTRQILFFCRDMRNAYNIQLYEGMSAEARKYGYMISLTDSLDYKEVRSLLVDGLILVNEFIAEEYLHEVGKNFLLPVIVVSYGVQINFLRSIPRVNCDLWKGTEKILMYLWEHGHQKIAYLDPFDLPDENPRLQAWKNFMKSAIGTGYEKYRISVGDEVYAHVKHWKTAFPEELVNAYHYVPELYFERGIAAAEIFHSKKCDATAVFCFNDEMALGFYQRMTELGYQIPDDLSIMGMDNVFANRYARKRLSTLDLRPQEHGALCVRTLMDLINDKKIKHYTELQTEIIPGETVKRIR